MERQDPEVAYLARHVPKGLEFGLRNYWYPVLQSADLPAAKPLGFKVLNEALVAWRDKQGHPGVGRDKSPHRVSKRSLGRVLEGDLQCAWHGLRFNAQGRCTLIPWEPDDTPLRAKLGTTAYPAEELGGWIWVYIGEPERFPPPRLADVVPEELLQPDQFMVFCHPIQVVRYNWLQGLDSSDGYHAGILHSDSQPLATDTWSGGERKPSTVPLAERRMKIVDTPQGLRGLIYDRGAGKDIHHGHFMDGWKGERWTLPGLFTIPIQPAANLPPYVNRGYQIPVDANHTQSSRWVSMRATTDEERERCTRLWHEFYGPRQRQVLSEDNLILESLGDLAESRAEESLFSVDRDVVEARRMMADAWTAQLDGVRPVPTRQALVFPI